MKTRPSKTKILTPKLIPITHSIKYHQQKAKKELFAAQKSSMVLTLLRALRDRLSFKVLSDRHFFSVLIDRLFFRDLGDRFFFFRYATIFYQKNVLLLFLFKTDVLFHIIFSKKRSRLTIS